MRRPSVADNTTLGDLTPQLVESDFWSDADLAEAGIPVVDVPFVCVGGGIGSFVMVDYLRLHGVPASDIAVLGAVSPPWNSYEYLTRVSQIPRPERIRSDASSTPDNIWGFPSYAVREAFGARSVRGFLAPLWQVLVEPILTDYYTPRVGAVFDSLRREHDRIGYAGSFVKGQVRMCRRRLGGGYFTILTPPEGVTTSRRVAYRSRYVHLAVGYPGLRFLPDLQRFRERGGDYSRVVNAYEPHEHIYEALRSQPGTVLVRGGGIVASRVLQRLIDDRDQYGLQTQVVHLFRSYVRGSHGPSPFMRRRGGNGWAYQGFNYPKSVWGGQLKARMRRLEGDDRKALYEVMGGTNTPHRRGWQRQLRRGRREGWYQSMPGTVFEMRMDGSGIRSCVDTGESTTELTTDFVIDCTGLEADIAEHRVLADLLQHGNAGRNPLGRLDVERTFEVRGTRNGLGRMYAVGAATLGGYFPGADTFLGLQISALEVCDDLAAQKFCRRMGVVRSLRQWWRWVRNKKV